MPPSTPQGLLSQLKRGGGGAGGGAYAQVSEASPNPKEGRKEGRKEERESRAQPYFGWGALTSGALDLLVPLTPEQSRERERECPKEQCTGLDIWGPSY